MNIKRVKILIALVAFIVMGLVSLNVYAGNCCNDDHLECCCGGNNFAILVAYVCVCDEGKLVYHECEYSPVTGEDDFWDPGGDGTPWEDPWQ